MLYVCDDGADAFAFEGEDGRDVLEEEPLDGREVLCEPEDLSPQRGPCVAQNTHLAACSTDVLAREPCRDADDVVSLDPAGGQGLIRNGLYICEDWSIFHASVRDPCFDDLLALFRDVTVGSCAAVGLQGGRNPPAAAEQVEAEHSPVSFLPSVSSLHSICLLHSNHGNTKDAARITHRNIYAIINHTPRGTMKKRGRPLGTKNTAPKRKAPPDIQSSIDMIDTHRPNQPADTSFKAYSVLKVKRPAGKVDDRMTMLQIHEKRIEHIQSSDDMDSGDIQYLVSAAKHLKRRHDDENSSMRGAMLNEYISDCFTTSYNGSRKAVSVLHDKMNEQLHVDHADDGACSCNMGLVIDIPTATQICTNCGSSAFYQDSTISDLWSEERVQVLSKIAYKRINHFREWCNSIQARQLPSESLDCVIQLVRQEIRKERIHDMSTITPARIRSYLHTLRLGKYYEFTSAIYAEITGKPIPHFSACTEHTLMQMFTAIQPVFDQMECKKRKNFLSYSYTLNKLAQIINETDILEFFPLLKSREKLYAQDQLWKVICDSMQWPFHPSI